MFIRKTHTVDPRQMGPFNPSAWPAARMLGLIALIQFLCALLFGIDIIYELHRDLISAPPPTWPQLLHLVVECFAVGLLWLGYVLSHRQMRRLRSAGTEQAYELQSLRGHFDDILLRQFAAWGLSKAESDIALLSLRGLKISEIAKLRATKEGTIKAQLSAIFRKAGVGTRTELLGVFMDEFLDFGASQERDKASGRAETSPFGGPGKDHPGAHRPPSQTTK